MKRVPLIAGLALAVVLLTVGVLVRPAFATNDPVYCSCGGADSLISQKYQECMSHGNPTFTSHCTEATGGNPGSYSYSCSWHYSCPGPDPDPGGPYNPFKQCGGGFGGGNIVDPTDASCQQ
jgi:hypothetical protein